MNIRLNAYLILADLLVVVGAFRAPDDSRRWRLYLWAIDKAAGVTDWGME